MKSTLFSLSLIALTSVSFAQSEIYNINASKSSLTWHAEKVTGSHDGQVDIKSGHLIWANNKLTGGSFTMDMNSLSCSDISDSETNNKLVRHLKSEDFFSVEKNPTAILVITRSIHQGSDRYKIEAKMTIKNITKDIKFIAEVKNENGFIHGSAEITIDRTEFDVRYGSGSFFDNLGNKTIYDDFIIKAIIVTNPSEKS